LPIIANIKTDSASNQSFEMLDISWGEIFVVGGIGMALAGRRDLPAASRFVGSQLGRVVGLLQGARARADQFAAQNELKQLQNELRSGLRELDQVKTELAVAASSQGMVGRSLGASVGSANRVDGKNNPMTSMPKPGGLPPMPPMPPIAAAAPILGSSVPTKDDASEFMTMEISDPTMTTPINQLPYVVSTNLAPEAQSERAVMEEEWVKQGIGFRSRAETGEWMGNVPTEGTGGKTGSELLENIIRQNLIFDQYDRVVGEQERAIHDRIKSIKTKRKTGGSEAEDRKDK
jgi:Sec-independent protein translocase protein TatA